MADHGAFHVLSGSGNYPAHLLAFEIVMMKKYKQPSLDNAERCVRLRKISKTGSRELTQDEHDFCRKMYKQYQTWYVETEERVFNETVPFGSVRYKDVTSTGE